MNHKLFELLQLQKIPSDFFCLIEALSCSKQEALLKLLEFEFSSIDGFSLRNRNITDLYHFDHELNSVASKILNLSNPRSSYFTGSSVFAESDLEWELSTLNRDGYAVSPQSLSEHTIASIRSTLSKMYFSSKNQNEPPKAGDELVKISDNNDTKMESGTFWLMNMNEAVKEPILASIAFDPYILNIASGYLGCTPIHVQTNSWFSFPAENSNQQLTTSAQLFHQDKEFTKFLKVFIYLNDVGLENGPHCYIKGSHINELNKKGVPLTSRLTDEEALNYYPPENITSLTGPAGTLVFGDTCAVHKGTPLTKGFRWILQLEYAASLYMSPIEPFDQLESSIQESLSDIPKRCVANYDSQARKRYLKRQLSNGPLSKITKKANSWLLNRKLKSAASKYKKSID
ncbi:phytanoyl-CoA dioxygenase family protein [Neptuniibacter sp.]|uniref:phytanoyl-CoA dioxygenase family protein n=1 Tax=Neptuniibacter sp. TaxID=1962643 RepID=UPI003B5C2300